MYNFPLEIENVLMTEASDYKVYASPFAYKIIKFMYKSVYAQDIVANAKFN